MTEVPLRLCEYDKKKRVLKLASEYFGMPSSFVVHSEKTNRKIEFIHVTESDPLFDHDFWDGEMAIYRPAEYLSTVDYMVIYNQY